MPPKPPLSSAMAWKCPQCTTRSFATSSKHLAVGPEHPRYIEIPEPPQQTVPYKPPVKGVLPIPRNVFAGFNKGRSDEEVLARSTQRPKRQATRISGSREEWKDKMGEIRRQNLRSGLKSLRSRQETEREKLNARSSTKQRERHSRLYRPEREDERLTAPSNNMDLDALFNKPTPDPTREDRIRTKQLNIQRHAEQKREERTLAVHDLYMNARDFIVTPEQLDKAIDAAFGTNEMPVKFGRGIVSDEAHSIWAEGRPVRIQDLVNKATGQNTGRAIDGHGFGASGVNKDRIGKIAETFTGGKIQVNRR